MKSGAVVLVHNISSIPIWNQGDTLRGKPADNECEFNHLFNAVLVIIHFDTHNDSMDLNE